MGRSQYPALINEAKRKNLLLMGHVVRGSGDAMTLQYGQQLPTDAGRAEVWIGNRRGTSAIIVHKAVFHPANSSSVVEILFTLSSSM